MTHLMASWVAHNLQGLVVLFTVLLGNARTLWNVGRGTAFVLTKVRSLWEIGEPWLSKLDLAWFIYDRAGDVREGKHLSAIKRLANLCAKIMGKATLPY